MMFRCSLFLIVLLFISCKSKDGAKLIGKNNLIIYLQPFDGITAAQTNSVFNEVKKVYAFIEIKKTIPLPSASYYPPRSRYRADSIIHILSRLISILLILIEYCLVLLIVFTKI